MYKGHPQLASHVCLSCHATIFFSLLSISNLSRFPVTNESIDKQIAEYYDVAYYAPV